MYINKQEYKYYDCSIRMSVKAMSSILYALVMTQAEMRNSYGVGIYQYDRKQNAYNNVYLKIYIHPSLVNKFEEFSGVKLKKPQSISLNSSSHDRIVKEEDEPE
jgi:hypothetical protein